MTNLLFKTPHMSVCMYNSVKQFAKMFIICGMKMIAARCLRSERGLTELRVICVLPDTTIRSIFGLVFST